MKGLRHQILESIRRIDDFLCSFARRKRILFVMSDGYGFACQAPVIESLLKLYPDDVIVRTTTDKPRPLDELSFTDPEEKKLFQQLYIPTRTAEFSKWHLVIDTHRNGFYPRRHTLRAYMHHGPGFGIHGSKVHIARDYDIFFGLSEAERYFFEQIEPDIFKDRTFIPVGFPKADSLVHQKDCSPAIRDRLGLPRRRKTILIASHWQTTSLLGTLGHRPFGILTESFPGCTVIQTGHPWFWNRQDKDGRVFTALKQIAGSRFNAFFIPFARAEELLLTADLLVSDHSSIVTSYSLLDRPIVWFDNPDNTFAIERIKTIYRNATQPISRMDDLYPACLQALTAPCQNAEGREVMMRVFYTHPGKSELLTAKVLIQLIEKTGRFTGTEHHKISDPLP